MSGDDTVVDPLQRGRFRTSCLELLRRRVWVFPALLIAHNEIGQAYTHVGIRVDYQLVEEGGKN